MPRSVQSLDSSTGCGTRFWGIGCTGCVSACNMMERLHTAALRWWKPRSRVLVASVPRCGSTFLLRSLAGLGPGRDFPDAPNCRFVRCLDHLPNATFLKTHSLAPESLPDDVRTVFLFGDPIHAIVSTMVARFDATHFRNCGFTADGLPRILERDDLGYERIFDSWMSLHDYPVLALRYEQIHQQVAALSRFLGRRVRLLPKRGRATRVSNELRDRLQCVYGEFAQKVASSPDASIRTRSSALDDNR
jgi:hypothetical protein